MSSSLVVRRIFNSRDENVRDTNASFYELEPFESILQALKWAQVKRRLPLCVKKTLHNRFMLANLLYLGYATGIVIIDFDDDLNPPPNNPSNGFFANISNVTSLKMFLLSQPIDNNPLTNQLYIALAIINLITGFLYCWAWHKRSALDIVMIPEYFNIIQAILYLWSSTWYSKQDIVGGYYTLLVNKIELVASLIGIFAAVGWIVAWFMTYVRIFGRGYTLDDPDVIACLSMLGNTIVYVTYYVQLNMSPEYYETNLLYKIADVFGLVEASFCVLACLRDDDWFWFLPVAGQYGIALGRVQVETKLLPQFGRPPILLTAMCQPTTTKREYDTCPKMNASSIVTVPIFVPTSDHSREIDS